MKELSQLSLESDTHSDNNNSTQHSSSSSSRGKSIKKTNEKLNVEHLIHLQKQQRKKLTKEERNQIQRIKNKEAAQKSRDHKKIYMESLEKTNNQLLLENNRLRDQIQNNKMYCCKCKMQLDQAAHCDQNPILDDHDMIEEQPIKISLFDDKNEFQRIPIQRGMSNFYSFILVISLIFVFCNVGESPIKQLGITNSNRLLIETSMLPITKKQQYNYPIQIQQSKQLNLYKSPQMNINQTSLINYFSKDSQTCVKNLMKRNLINSAVAQKNLRFSQENKDILFCQLPKLYQQHAQQGFLSRIFDIILKADEVRRIAMQSGGISLQSFQYSGLYALTVQIRSIRKYGTSQQCLLEGI